MSGRLEAELEFVEGSSVCLLPLTPTKPSRSEGIRQLERPSESGYPNEKYCYHIGPLRELTSSNNFVQCQMSVPNAPPDISTGVQPHRNNIFARLANASPVQLVDDYEPFFKNLNDAYLPPLLRRWCLKISLVGSLQTFM
jgi:hypothetical protein